MHKMGAFKRFTGWGEAQLNVSRDAVRRSRVHAVEWKHSLRFYGSSIASIL